MPAILQIKPIPVHPSYFTSALFLSLSLKSSVLSAVVLRYLYPPYLCLVIQIQAGHCLHGHIHVLLCF